MNTPSDTNKKTFLSIIILSFPLVVMMIKEGTFSNVSYHVLLLGNLTCFSLIFYYILIFLYTIVRALESESENQGDETSSSNSLFEQILFAAFSLLLILSTLTLLFIASIRLSEQQIVNVKMGSVEMASRGRGSVYETRIEKSPNAPYLIAYELDIAETRLAEQIRVNPNVQVAVRKNAVGFSVELLP